MAAYSKVAIFKAITVQIRRPKCTHKIQTHCVPVLLFSGFETVFG